MSNKSLKKRTLNKDSSDYNVSSGSDSLSESSSSNVTYSEETLHDKCDFNENNMIKLQRIPGDTRDLRNIIYKKINDKIGVGRYACHDLYIMTYNGYANASDICDKMFSAKIDVMAWSSKSYNKDMINGIAQVLEINEAKLMHKIEGCGRFDGVYVHPVLLSQIVMSVSPTSIIKASDIISASIIKDTIIDRMIEEDRRRGF